MVKKQTDPEASPLRPSVFHVSCWLYLTATYTAMESCWKSLNTPTVKSSWARHLYGAIKRLLSERLIVEVDERPDPELDDERRRYYRLTDFGQKVLKAEVQRISKMVSVAQRKRLIPKPRG